jgi:Protein of unknown function (DUF1353)
VPKKLKLHIFWFTLALLSPNQSSLGADYDSFEVGKLHGSLIVQWIKPDLFIFLPDKEKPLTFVRSTGDKITPGRMLTDGGSIPRPLWILRNYSPWGYAPAFVIHDWLFTQHQCKLENFEKYDYHIAATIMAEIMKTMMETQTVDVDKFTLISMYLAVDSPIAGVWWNNQNCELPPNNLKAEKPLAEFKISFPD